MTDLMTPAQRKRGARAIHDGQRGQRPVLHLSEDYRLRRAQCRGGGPESQVAPRGDSARTTEGRYGPVGVERNLPSATGRIPANFRVDYYTPPVRTCEEGEAHEKLEDTAGVSPGQ